MQTPAKYIIVITTCPTEAEAGRLAGLLMEKRLAACVQASAIKSTYRWLGSIETADEVRLMIKATAADYSEIEALIKLAVSYQNPEIIAIPIVAGSQIYFDWMDQETSRLP
jgi:periplasmic divalent cation tolerance protein